MKWEENLKQRVEAGQFGGLEESEKHEVLALISSLENYKKIVKALENELIKSKQPATLAVDPAAGGSIQRVRWVDGELVIENIKPSDFYKHLSKEPDNGKEANSSPTQETHDNAGRRTGSQRD